MQSRTVRRPARRSAQGEAFSAFLERNALREKRQRSRRNMIIISLAVHAVALAALVFYSLWDTDELWTPSVGVKMFSRSAAPPAASVLVAPRAPAPPPAVPPR